MSYTFPTLGTVVGTLLPSGDPTGATDTNALQALLNQGPGTIQMAAGTFYITNVISSTYAPQRIVGAGRGQTIISAVTPSTVPTDNSVIRMYNPTSPGSTGWPNITAWGGGVTGLTIDGSNTTQTVVTNGLHIGDGEEYDIDVQIMNFDVPGVSPNPGSYGLLLDNAYWWTEKAHIRAALSNNDTACALTVTTTTGGTNSFEYNDISLDIFAAGAQQGLVIQNGAYLLNSNLRIRGNMEYGPSSITAGTCLAVMGVNTMTPISYSRIGTTFLDIAIEADLPTGSGYTVKPRTIFFDTNAGNSILGCTGILAFTNEAWTFTNLNGISQTKFGFAGTVVGDTTLCPGSSTSAGGGPGLFNVGSPVIYAQNDLPSNGQVFDANGDFFAATLTPTPLTVAPGVHSPSIPGPQRKIFMFTQAASGGPYEVEWASSITWLQGDVAPVMPAAPGAMMIVELVTFDGVTWYGLVPAGGSTVAASLAVTPANPTGTTHTSAVMMGLGLAGCVYTPISSSGKVRVTIKAEGGTVTANVNFTVGAYYGTGTAPANGAAATGALFGAVATSVLRSQNIATQTTFVADGILTGLTAGTQIWADLQLYTSNTLDQVDLVNVSCVFEELAA